MKIDVIRSRLEQNTSDHSISSERGATLSINARHDLTLR